MNYVLQLISNRFFAPFKVSKILLFGYSRIF